MLVRQYSRTHGEESAFPRSFAAMAKTKKQKLKVFRTPIGFHDAYVAAPSQKAALEAWGTDTNLFASGSAEVVTDPALTEVALERPGEVIKVLRGSQAEQIAALGKVPKRKAAARAAANENMAEAKPQSKPKPPRPPKPSRKELASAEEAVDKLEKRHSKELAAPDEEQQALDRKRRDVERRQARDLERAHASLGFSTDCANTA